MPLHVLLGQVIVWPLLRCSNIRQVMRSIAPLQMWLAFIALSLGMTACGNDKPTIALTPRFPPEISFLRQKEGNGERVTMEALLIGELVLVHGCLRVNSNDSDSSYLPVWPPGFMVSIENDSIVILDEAGQVATRLGDRVRLGGGEVPMAIASAYAEQPLPNECPGPYWIVGDIVETAGDMKESK